MALPYDRQPKPDGVTGRTKEVWPPLPRERDIAAYRVDAVLEYLTQHRNTRRPPLITASILALACWLHEHEYPWPTRNRVAEWVSGETDKDHYFANGDQTKHKKASTVDAVLTTALAHEEIFEEIRVVPGRVAGRSSSRRFRYIVPSQELLDVYNAPRAPKEGDRSKSVRDHGRVRYGAAVLRYGT